MSPQRTLGPIDRRGALHVPPLALLPLHALAACATPETRLKAGLEDAGLSPRMATCMAGRMAERLSLWQLRTLSALRGARKTDYGTLSVGEFLHKVRALQDP